MAKKKIAPNPDKYGNVTIDTGILKRRRIRLTVDNPEVERLLDILDSQLPWSTWFDSLGPAIEAIIKTADKPTAGDAQYALHLWRWCREHLDTKPDAITSIHNAMQLGKLLERIEHVRPFEEYAAKGIEVKVHRPAAMRDGKADKAAERKKANRRKAVEAMIWARNNHQTAADTDNQGVLRAAAAERIERSVVTLERWLGIRK